MPGFVDARKREWYIDYGMVLSEYGGDSLKARKEYRKRLVEELSEGKGIKESVIGQSILGAASFVAFVTDKYLKTDKARELPSAGALHRHRSKEEILGIIQKETGKRLDEIKREKGVLRQITMELLYRVGGLRGDEIGRLMAIGYTSVSQERGRLHARAGQDKKVKALLTKLERKCQR